MLAAFGFYEPVVGYIKPVDTYNSYIGNGVLYIGNTDTTFSGVYRDAADNREYPSECPTLNAFLMQHLLAAFRGLAAGRRTKFQNHLTYHHENWVAYLYFVGTKVFIFALLFFGS